MSYPLDHYDETLSEFKEQVTCPLCFKTVVNSLESHFESEHNEFECPFCDLLFDNGLALNQHVNSVHSGEETNSKKGNDSLFDSKLPNYAASGASNWGQNDFKSVSDSVNDRKCPVCMVVVKEGIQFLQAHVEAHFSGPELSDFDTFKSSKSRTQSANSLVSLIANVDENFELDQVMTLEDSDSEVSHKNMDCFEPYCNSFQSGKF